MSARSLARAVYSRAARSGVLQRPLRAIRAHPRVRRLARRHVDVLLSGEATWANLDGALRLLAEDAGQPVVFGPWELDAGREALYWVPFVRWAQEHFSLDPARVGVVSRGGVGGWYAGICDTYAESSAGAVAALPGAVWFRPGPFLRLVERYRSGLEAPRPLLKRSAHRRLAPTEPRGNGGPLAVALAPSEAFPASAENRRVAGALREALTAIGPVVVLDEETGPKEIGARHALFAAAGGLVASYSDLALVGALSGVPTIALRSASGEVVEPDLDLATRVVTRLGGSFTVLDPAGVETLRRALA